MVVRELRKMANESKAAGKIAPRSADEKLKWLEWPEFVTVRSSPMSHTPVSLARTVLLVLSRSPMRCASCGRLLYSIIANIRMRSKLRGSGASQQLAYSSLHNARVDSSPQINLQILKKRNLRDCTFSRLKSKILNTLPVLAAQVVQELRKECAGRDGSGRLREGSAVAWSLQRYLIFAILSCIPGPPLLLQ